MSLKYCILTLFVLAVFVQGCASRYSLSTSGLSSSHYDLKVTTSSTKKVEFVNSSWQLENWEYSKDFKKWSRKRGTKYSGKVYTDLDEDGNPEVVKNYFSELELVHQKNDARIYFDVTPVPRSKTGVNMEVFLDNFVENNSSNVTWFRSSRFSSSEVAEKSYATKVVDQQPFDFMGNNGIVASLERADLNQLKLDSEHRSEMMAIMFLRVDDIHTVVNKSKKTKTKFPGIVAVILVSKPKYFQELEPDFFKLIKSIYLNGKSIAVPDVAFEKQSQR